MEKEERGMLVKLNLFITSVDEQSLKNELVLTYNSVIWK